MSIRPKGYTEKFFVEQMQDDEGSLCVFEVVPTAAGVQLADPTGMCRLSDCGARGGYNGAVFSHQERVEAPAANHQLSGGH